MKIKEAIEATHTVYVGVEARTVKRKDRRGRIWYLVTARGQFFLVRPDRTAYKQVNQAFVDYWEDWEPQTDGEARKESAFMNSDRGLRYRNVILGLVLGKLPKNMKAPDHLPEGW
jgi:hypothetical protein